MLERLSVDASKFDLFLFNLKMEKDEARSLLINTICKLQAVFFWPCDEKKETEMSCDNWIGFKGKGSRGKKREKI